MVDLEVDFIYDVAPSTQMLILDQYVACWANMWMKKCGKLHC